MHGRSQRFVEKSRKRLAEYSHDGGKPWNIEVRTWYIQHFKLPPTDERYLSTPFEMMEFLFLDFLHSLDYEEIHGRYQKYLKKKPVLDELDTMDDDLKSMGYDDEDIKKIKAEYWEKA